MVQSAAAHTSPDICRRPSPFADEVAFRDGLAKLASGVAVVAWQGGDGPMGLLVSSLTGLSTEPPRILFCVRKAAAAHAALLKANDISVSLLGEADRAEAERFLGSAAEPLDGAWREIAGAPPVRTDALAAFSGSVHCRIDAGTHTVFILDVARAEVRREAEPLVYFERGFHALA